MDVQPRQQYGLGSFVKKAVKGVKSAVSGAVDAVKDVAKSDVGKLALLTAGAYYAPAMFGGTAGFGPGSTYRQFLGGLSPVAIPGTGTSFGGSAYGLGEAIRGGISSIIPKSTAGKSMLAAAGIGGLTGFMAQQGMSEEEIESVKRNPTALRGYLAQYYSNLNPKANPREVDAFVERNMSEYSTSFATGGRAGYAFGSPEENAKQASGVMGLPLNQNPAGVTELDLRETGGFIPPVGVKEKADDIPAMLSNNEFVFTADAVRGMGDGDVNKGAQRMYDMMKKLENGGRV